MCDGPGDPLGGVDSLASAVISLPSALALLAVFLATLQGVLTMESADPCRLSLRKMNILLGLELAEVIVSLVSEILSFVELRSAFQTRLQYLHWVAPSLLAAGFAETLVDVYFTLAVVTKSRVGWLPISASGSSSHWWELFPFSITAALSCTLVGWRLRWWWKGISVSNEIAVEAIRNETALQEGTMGFAVGWTVGISTLVFVIMMLSDCAEDGANYIMSLSYLWRPDTWIDYQESDIKVWYRNFERKKGVQQFVAAAVLDGTMDVPETVDQVIDSLERQPLHSGNAIVGTDREVAYKEDRNSSRLHKVILIAEHVVALPLLVVVSVALSRLHGTLDCETFNVIRQLTDSVIIIAFLEIAIAIKNVLWSISGTAKIERGTSSDSERLRELHRFYHHHLCEANQSSVLFEEKGYRIPQKES